LDAVVFTVGIGENSIGLRERVCRDAQWLGIELDAAAKRDGRAAHQHGAKPCFRLGVPETKSCDCAPHVAKLLD
jgi:acetate kinase